MMLPTGNFRRLEMSDEAAYVFMKDFVSAYKDTDEKGAFFTVDLYFPNDVHDRIDLAPCKKGCARDQELSEKQVDRRRVLKSAVAPGGKLLPYLGEHVRTMMTVGHLKMWMRLGAKVTKVYAEESWTFTQSMWLGEFIKTIFAKRQASKDETRRDILKLWMNALYGKFLQNSQGHCDTKVCT